MATKRGILDGYKTYDTSRGFGTPEEWRETFYERMTGKEAKQRIYEAKQTPYEILGIPKNATGKEIKTAFRRLIMQWHPDKNSHRLEEAEAMSKKIIAAYTILTQD